jgi:ornithine cyclodeaminase/alanine dehydrogenase-like protein (mu-crystallin family)
MLFLKEAEVRALLPMKDCIEQLRTAFRAIGEDQAINQPRRRLILPSGAVLHQMAASCGKYFGTKIYSTHLKHGANFLFVLYESETASPLALLEADSLGQIRTGAASGLATDVLARRDASVMAVIGSGYQARSQAEAVCAVRPIREIRVWSRSEEKRATYAREMSEQLGVEVIAPDSAREAVEGAHVVSTATFSREPVVVSEWVVPAAHVNAIGTNVANRRETPAELVLRANPVVVDSVEQAKIEAGDLIQAFSEDDWDWRVVGLDKAMTPGWQSSTTGDITFFKSVGLALEDVAAAALVYERAKADGVGAELPILYS